MGGMLIIISIVIPTLLWADLRNPYVWIALFGLVSFGAIGFLDDYAKVTQAAQSGPDRRGASWSASCCVGFALARRAAGAARVRRFTPPA